MKIFKRIIRLPRFNFCMHFAESQCTSEQWNDEKKLANVFTMVLVHDDIKY